MKISIAASKIRTAMHGKNVVDTDRNLVDQLLVNCKGNTASVEVDLIPISVVDNLLLEDLSDAQRRTLSLFSLGAKNKGDEIFMTIMARPHDVHNAIAALTNGNQPNAEIIINDRWYPIIVTSTIQKTYGGDGNFCHVISQYKLGKATSGFSLNIGDNFFLDDDDKEITYTLAEVFNRIGLRPLQTDMREHFDLLRKAERHQVKDGHALFAIGKAIFFENKSWWKGPDIVELGTDLNPGSIVVEGVMEHDAGQESNLYHHGGEIWTLPFIRVFSFERKRYGYIDVRDVVERTWDADAINKLSLPDDLDGILRKVFDAPVDQLFADIVSGKAGGMIILAQGGPGVGKTMTAEVFSEHTKRPLYVLEMAELGTNLQSVEDNLRRVFRRATRWNAVLLLDEADVFMAKRDNNLERSAIVGVFLRLLDYYKGMLFLTTNRSDVIDPAFKSRITLSLNYPPLDRARRSTIWLTMLGAAGISLVDRDGNPADVDGIPDVDINGRQIRNTVRLLRVLHGTKVTPEQVKDVCRFVCV